MHALQKLIGIATESKYINVTITYIAITYIYIYYMHGGNSLLKIVDPLLHIAIYTYVYVRS